MINTTPPSADHLDRIRELWGLQDELRMIRFTENFVYSARLADQEVILRVTAATRREASELESELDWLRFLAARGLSVASAIPAASARLLETVAEPGAAYHASVFHKAPGTHLPDPTAYTDTIVREWGAYIGRMQRLTREYRPSPGVRRRADWRDDACLRTALRSLDRSDPTAHDALSGLLDQLAGLSRDPEAYGLIHADLHPGNFHVENGSLTAFDFDDSCHHWQIYDLAVACFSYEAYHRGRGVPCEPSWFRQLLIEGYEREHALPAEWRARIPLFIRFRIAVMYHWCKTRLAENAFGEGDRAWCERMFPWFREELGRPL